jgi:hypothetical protein
MLVCMSWFYVLLVLSKLYQIVHIVLSPLSLLHWLDAIVKEHDDEVDAYILYFPFSCFILFILGVFTFSFVQSTFYSSF